ncbi:MAG: NYN domain-containing protein [Oscillospiraceae bacterium]|nr:NYN domain-containing protein [Oscillospiraceae bacterium]
MDLNNMRLAVLIDAENVPRNCIKGVMEEIAIYGTPTIKRIYGDWTNPSIAGWKTPLLENAITPIQQYSYTYGKNSSDSAMIIDAMDLLYTEKTDGFVIVSSDSDFTRLAIRLREAGQRVIGIGEKKTPSAFIAACDKFTYIEVVRAKAADTRAADEPEPAAAKEKPHAVSQNNQSGQNGQNAAAPPKQRAAHVPETVVQLIADSVADLSEDDAVFMGELGNLILKKQPDFDCRNFGYKSLSALIKSLDRFDIDFRQTSDPNIKHPYVKDRQASAE